MTDGSRSTRTGNVAGTAQGGKCGVPPVREGEPGGLTKRELEIAELVAQGMSIKAIAAGLVIGGRTVETHIENILVKLGFTSRAQVASWLTEHKRQSP